MNNMYGIPTKTPLKHTHFQSIFSIFYFFEKIKNKLISEPCPPEFSRVYTPPPRTTMPVLAGHLCRPAQYTLGKHCLSTRQKTREEERLI